MIFFICCHSMDTFISNLCVEDLIFIFVYRGWEERTLDDIMVNIYPGNFELCLLKEFSRKNVLSLFLLNQLINFHNLLSMFTLFRFYDLMKAVVTIFVICCFTNVLKY